MKYVVSRAVMPLADLIKIIKKNISPKQQNALPNGLICLKGGELEHETMPFKHKTVIQSLSDSLLVPGRNWMILAIPNE